MSPFGTYRIQLHKDFTFADDCRLDLVSKSTRRGKQGVPLLLPAGRALAARGWLGGGELTSRDLTAPPGRRSGWAGGGWRLAGADLSGGAAEQRTQERTARERAQQSQMIGLGHGTLRPRGRTDVAE